MRKKVFKHIMWIVLISIPLYFLFLGWGACNAKYDGPHYKYEKVTATEPRVYITVSGDCYHSFSCGYLKSCIPVGLYEAKNKGYYACSACHGRSNGTITTTYEKKVEYDPTTRNAWLCVPLALLVGGFAYLFIYANIQENSPAPSSNSRGTSYTSSKGYSTSNSSSSKNYSSNRTPTTSYSPSPSTPRTTSAPSVQTTAPKTPPTIIYHDTEWYLRNTGKSSIAKKTTTSTTNGYWGIPIIDDHQKKPNDPNLELKNKLREYPLEKLKRLIGLRLSHKTYGEGTIKDISKEYIWVKFDNLKEIKLFQYPDGIVDGYLTPLKKE